MRTEIRSKLSQCMALRWLKVQWIFLVYPHSRSKTINEWNRTSMAKRKEKLLCESKNTEEKWFFFRVIALLVCKNNERNARSTFVICTSISFLYVPSILQFISTTSTFTILKNKCVTNRVYRKQRDWKRTQVCFCKLSREIVSGVKNN